jgi:hypothetical protein
MAKAEEENITNPPTRRGFLKGASAVAAIPLIATMPIEATAAAVPQGDWCPPDVEGKYFCLLEERSARPLSFILRDGSFRDASESELAGFLLENPYFCDQVSPGLLRRILPDHDGEFFALLYERCELRRAGWNHETHQRRPEAVEALAENLRSICEAPTITDAGCAMKLRLLMEDAWGYAPELSAVQQRQLLWAAIAWLQQGLNGRQSMQVRDLDRAKLTEALKGYAQEVQS